MEIQRSGTQATRKGPEENFTGDVYVDNYFSREAPSRVTGAVVTFTPGARTAWHTHPLGQTLFVTSGRGWTQCEGEDIVEINAGDIIWCPPGHKHWHGATPDTMMTHLVIQEALDGKNVTWLEKVDDETYLAGPPKR